MTNTNLENLTYNQIPKFIQDKEHRWILFSGSPNPYTYAKRMEKALTTEGYLTAGITPAKETQLKRIKGGYVVYYHT